MDWGILSTQPLWVAFWQTPEVQAIEQAIRARLEADVTDPYTLGLLRGQLHMIRRLRALPAQMVQKHEAIEENLSPTALRAQFQRKIR